MALRQNRAIIAWGKAKKAARDEKNSKIAFFQHFWRSAINETGHELAR